MTSFKKPVLIPSERANKCGVDNYILAYCKTMYKLRALKTENVFGIGCVNEKECCLFKKVGHRSRGKIEAVGGVFLKWIIKPELCGCVYQNRAIKHFGKYSTFELNH